MFLKYFFFVFLCLTGTGYSKDSAKSIAHSRLLSVWPWKDAVLTNSIQSFSPRTIYQPERLSKLIMSLSFFSPTHSQAKKRDKGVSLTSRSLPASSYRSLPPAKRTFNKSSLPLDFPDGSQGKEHRT